MYISTIVKSQKTKHIKYVISLLLCIAFFIISLFSTVLAESGHDITSHELSVCELVDINKDLYYNFTDQFTEFYVTEALDPQFLSLSVSNSNTYHNYATSPFLVLYSSEYQDSIVAIPAYVHAIHDGDLHLESEVTKNLRIDMTPIVKLIGSGDYQAYVHFSFHKTVTDVMPEILRYTPHFLSSQGYELTIESNQEKPSSWLHIDEAIFNEENIISNFGLLPLRYLQDVNSGASFNFINTNSHSSTKGDVHISLYRGIEPQSGVKLLSFSRPYHLVPESNFDFNVNLDKLGEIDSSVYTLLVEEHNEEGSNLIGFYIFAEDEQEVLLKADDYYRVSYMDRNQHDPIVCWREPTENTATESGRFVDEIYDVKYAWYSPLDEEVATVNERGFSVLHVLDDDKNNLYTLSSAQVTNCDTHPHFCRQAKKVSFFDYKDNTVVLFGVFVIGLIVLIVLYYLYKRFYRRYPSI